MAREINLVPDIKNEMIKALKLRNLIFFICIVTAAVSVIVLAIFGSIVGGQQLAVDSKKNTIANMSSKLNSYGDLDDFLTIRDQLGNLATLTDNKKVLSRTFNILSALIPTGPDTITISELNVNLSDTTPTFSFDAQANAGKEPFIDYNVLDSFKKSMKYMRYDYGNYIDRDGATIPAYCIIETGDDGATLNDPDRGLYAYWTIEAEGCNPSDAPVGLTEEEKATEAETRPDEDSDNSGNVDDSEEDTSSDLLDLQDLLSDNEEDQEEESTSDDADAYQPEVYNGLKVVRIWRTPQYDDWYKDGYMTEDGQISDIQHFDSQCITYQGEKSGNSDKLKWTETNESCMLVPDGDDGIRISDSSNGRGAGDELVLRFSAVISLNPEVYSFNNYHMIAIAPAGRRNVTDSYVQIQAMFGEAARDCEAGDTACSSNTQNVNGGGN